MFADIDVVSGDVMCSVVNNMNLTTLCNIRPLSIPAFSYSVHRQQDHCMVATHYHTRSKTTVLVFCWLYFLSLSWHTTSY